MVCLTGAHKLLLLVLAMATPPCWGNEAINELGTPSSSSTTVFIGATEGRSPQSKLDSDSTEVEEAL